MSDIEWQDKSDNRRSGCLFLGWQGDVPDKAAEGRSDFLPHTNRPTVQNTFMSPEAKFALLHESWLRNRDELGSASDMTSFPAYQMIIEMRNDALRPILRCLQEEGDEPDFWFTALMSITGTNPVPEEHRGDMRKMAQDWLAWASRNGCI